MKMKRYFAADARTALRELREEQGPDAVILSNRKVSGGVEIIAALDYEEALVNASLGNPNQPSGEADADGEEAVAAAAQDGRGEGQTVAGGEASEADAEITKRPPSPFADETPEGAAETPRSNVSPISDAKKKSPEENDRGLEKIKKELKGLRNIMEAPMMQFSWGELERVQPLYASLLKQLLGLGLSPKLCEQIASSMLDRGLGKNSWVEALKMLADMLPVSNDDMLRDGGIISLIGPTGVGKTTTIAKIAARFALRHGRRNIALVTTDSYRIGAHEQLRTYGRILGVPVQVAADSFELEAVLKSCADKKLVLVDTSGVSQRDQRLAEQLSTLDIAAQPIRNYLVLSATGQMSLQEDVIKSFSRANLRGCILTKVDEAASLGEILSVLTEQALPVAYVSDGQKVPDDLHPARGQLLVKEAVTLMQKMKKTPSEQELAFMFGGMINNANI